MGKGYGSESGLIIWIRLFSLKLVATDFIKLVIYFTKWNISKIFKNILPNDEYGFLVRTPLMIYKDPNRIRDRFFLGGHIWIRVILDKIRSSSPRKLTIPDRHPRLQTFQSIICKRKYNFAVCMYVSNKWACAADQAIFLRVQQLYKKETHKKSNQAIIIFLVKVKAHKKWQS